MFKSKYRRYTKRLITILFLIQLSLILNKEKEDSSFFDVQDEKDIKNVVDSDTKESEDKSNENEYLNTLSDFQVYSTGDLHKLGEAMEELSSEASILKKETEEVLKMKNVNLGLFDSQECLFDKNNAKEILNKYEINNKSIDENMRFILGPCNPILFVPGLYSTRLVVQIDCKKFAEKEEDMVDLRLFCGNSICKNDYEEHVIWPALFDSPFELHFTKESKYSACFGYFFKFHKRNECPKVKSEEGKTFGSKNSNSQNSNPEFLKNLSSEELEEEICLYNNAVKITFWGGTEKTESTSQCGVKAIKDIVSVGGTPIKESWVNSGSSRAFEGMYDRYYEMGYRTGFSMAGVPYDFRRFVSTNDLFENIFINQIERLYENAGKPVIIIAHSFGCLNSLNQIFQGNKTFLKKIKKFVAIAPPFAGAPKLVELFLHGSKEFDQKVKISGFDIFDVKLDSFGQKLSLPMNPTAYELRPNPIIHKLFKDEKWKDFRLAIEERLHLEKECHKKDCDEDYITEFSKNFFKVFKNFPSFKDTECLVTDIMKSEKYLEIMKSYSQDNKLYIPTLLPCRNEMFNTVSCPTVRFRASDDEDSSEIESKHCHGKKEEVTIEVEIANKTDLFIHMCNNNNSCLDKFFHNHYAYPYLDKKMIDLVEKFMVVYAKEYPDIQINITNYFDTREMLKRKVEKMLEYQKQISKTTNLDFPGVDTMIIYGSYLPTKTAYVFDEVKNLEKFDKSDILAKGGDGTVPTYSSLLIGLKWLYEKKMQNSKQNIQLVEYCSILSKKDSKYTFDKDDLNKEFMGISCECLESDYFYNFKKTSTDTCDHGKMIGDSKLIQFLENYLLDNSNTDYETDTLPEDKKNSLINYDSAKNYEALCNYQLRKFAEQS